MRLSFLLTVMLKIRRECSRLFHGQFHHTREARVVAIALILIAGFFFAMCWYHYPTPETFSPMKDTISNFGKLKKYKTPVGMMYFRLGFATLCLLLAAFTGYRRSQLSVLFDSDLKKTTDLYLWAVICLLLTLLFPDSREYIFLRVKYQIVHGIFAVAAIILFAVAILRDAWTIRKIHKIKKSKHLQGRKKFARAFIPFMFFSLIFFAGLLCLCIWEIRCLLDDSLKRWPGEGIFSIPLWEWILFAYLILFICWYPFLLRGRSTPKGGIGSIHAWSQTD